jgi:hypothetical protein
MTDTITKENLYYDATTKNYLYRHYLLLISVATDRGHKHYVDPFRLSTLTNAIAYPLAIEADDSISRYNLRSSRTIPLTRYEELSEQKKADVDEWWERRGRMHTQNQIQKVDKRSKKVVEE